MRAVNQLIDLQLETRKVWLHRFNWQDYQQQVQISQADVEAYYNANKDELKSDAMVDLAYIQLIPANIEVKQVTEDELEQQYESYKQQLGVSDERMISQILLSRR